MTAVRWHLCIGTLRALDRIVVRSCDEEGTSVSSAVVTFAVAAPLLNSLFHM